MQKNFLSEVLTNHRSWKDGLPYIVSVKNAQIDKFWNAAWTKIEHMQLDIVTLRCPVGFISTAGTSGLCIPYLKKWMILDPEGSSKNLNNYSGSWDPWLLILSSGFWFQAHCFLILLLCKQFALIIFGLGPPGSRCVALRAFDLGPASFCWYFWVFGTSDSEPTGSRLSSTRLYKFKWRCFLIV